MSYIFQKYLSQQKIYLNFSPFFVSSLTSYTIQKKLYIYADKLE